MKPKFVIFISETNYLMKYIFATIIALIFVHTNSFSQSTRNVFLEHFSNTNCVDCVEANASLYNILNDNPNLIHITYHVGLPDQTGYFYEQNVEDNTAAQNFYNITEIPELYVNGIISSDNPDLITQNTLNSIYSQNLTSPFIFSSLEIEEQTNGSFNVVVIIGTEVMPEEGNYVIKMAAVESEIEQNTSNGESLHINVMREMLEGFEGKPFNPPYVGNRTLFSFKMESEWQEENLFVIGWIQNVDTKEIVTITSSKSFEAPLQSSITELINVSCFEETNGGINISVENGVLPYTFLWSNGSTNQNLTNVPAGVYSVEITDANGTTITQQASVQEPPSFIVEVDIFAESNSNSNGEAEITISGATPFVSNGVPFYKIEWSNGLKDSLSNKNLSEGTYNFTITDANNCTYSEDFFIANNIGDLRCSFEFKNPRCNGESSGYIALNCRNFSPPVLYSWNDGPINRERFNLKAGTYSVVVTDQLNSVYNLLIELEEPAPLINNLEITNETDDLNNGVALANPSGGAPPYRFRWIPGGETTLFIDSLSAEDSFGNVIQYVCNVTDYNGCALSQPFTLLPSSTGLDISIVEKKNISCFGTQDGSIEIKVSGGNMGYAYDIDWFINNGNTFEEIATTPSNTLLLNNLSKGTYLATVTDDDNTMVTDTIIIEEPLLLEINTEKCDVQVDANGNVIQNGLASARPIGGVPPYLYQWSNGSANDNTNIAISSNLTITVFDANNCQAQKTIFISESTETCLLSSNEVGLLNSDVIIYPSLVKSAFNIQSTFPINNINIINLEGKTVFQQDYINQYEFFESIEEVPNGIYFIRISTKKGIYTKKIMKH